MQRFFRRWMLTYLATLGVLLGLLVWLNVRVDPHEAYPGWQSAAYVGHKPNAGSRQTKGNQLDRGAWTVLLVGTSRVEVGLDPMHDVFRDDRVYNLGLSDGALVEFDAAVRYALEHNPIERVIWELDLSYFDPARPVRADFPQTAFYPGQVRLEYHLSNLLGQQPLERSLKALQMQRDGETSDFSPQGFLLRDLHEPGSPQRALFEMPTDEAVTYDPAGMARVEAVLRHLRGSGVRVDVFVSPMHASRMVWLDRVEGLEVWSTWLNDLSDTVSRVNADGPGPEVALWSYLTLTTINTEPIPAADDTDTVMSWYWDPVHFTRQAGDVLLREVVGGETLGYGVCLDPSHTASYVEGFKRELRIYSDQHAEEITDLFSPED